MSMKRALVLALGTALASAVIAVPLATAQAPAKKAAAYKAPRNAFGQPDFGGAWSNASLTPESRAAEHGDRLILTPAEIRKLEGDNSRLNELDAVPVDPNAPKPSVGGDLRPGYTSFTGGGGNVGGYDRGWLETGDRVMYVNGQPRSSIITTANGRAPPRKGQAAAAPAGRGGGGGGGAGRGGQFDNHESRPLGERCIISFGRNAGPPMLSNSTYNNNYHIVQGRDHVAIEVEMVHDMRIIRLNSTHRKDNVRPWFGDSIGWYEGETLVVETTHIPQRQAYQGAWENLKVTERFTRVGPNRLHYAFTVDDPTVWDAKWGGEYEFAPLNGRLAEYACHEGNYALPGILAGARQDERNAAAAAAPGRGTQ